MGRAIRGYEAGQHFHVTSHSVDERELFRDDTDRLAFIGLLSRAVRSYRPRCYAVCLMTTHIHFLVGLREPNLAETMRLVNGSYSRHFNRRHERRGPVFESRYSAKRVQDESHLIGAIRYVALNPVPVLVPHPADWPWSTYGQLIGVRRPWPFFSVAPVLALFDPVRDRAIAAVQELVER